MLSVIGMAVVSAVLLAWLINTAFKWMCNYEDKEARKEAAKYN